ncbi:MAG: CpcT/CpeT family chromophore lyase [Bacteroidota bacterium]
MKYFYLLPALLILACQNSSVEEEKFIPSNGKIIPSIPANFQQEIATDERTYTLMERELEYLMNIWEGEYDNVEQLDFDKFAGKKGVENGGHLRVHSSVKRLNIKGFGDYVIYLETYQNDDPNDLYQQVILELSADDEAKGILAKVYHFKNPKAHLSVGQSLEKLEINNDKLYPACEILLQREGMAFVSRKVGEGCVNKGKDYRLRISEEDYWFQERKYDAATGNFLSDNQQLAWYQLEKARCFACMIDFPREEGGRPVETKHYIKIHDQGGKFEFDYKDGRHMVLGMRNTWSFGMQRETFVIFIQEEDQTGKTLIYSWGNPGADRIGFNPGWIRVQCDLDTPENVAFQHGLRPDS